MRYKWLSVLKNNEPPETAIDANRPPSSRLVASRRNSRPEAMTVVTPCSAGKYMLPQAKTGD